MLLRLASYICKDSCTAWCRPNTFRKKLIKMLLGGLSKPRRQSALNNGANEPHNIIARADYNLVSFCKAATSNCCFSRFCGELATMNLRWRVQRQRQLIHFLAVQQFEGILDTRIKRTKLVTNGKTGREIHFSRLRNCRSRNCRRLCLSSLLSLKV